jgi:hypothetical protein
LADIHIDELQKQIDALVKAAAIEGPNLNDSKQTFIEHLEGLQRKLAPYQEIEPLSDDELDIEDELDIKDKTDEKSKFDEDDKKSQDDPKNDPQDGDISSEGESLTDETVFEENE